MTRLEEVLKAGQLLRGGVEEPRTGNRYDSTWGDLKRHHLQHARMKEMGIPKEWYRDRDYVIAVGRLPIRGPGLGIFSHLSTELQKDKEVVIACIEGNPAVYYRISYKLRKDRDVCETFIASVFFALEGTSNDVANGWKSAVLFFLSEHDRKWRDNTSLLWAYNHARAAREEDHAESVWKTLKADQAMKPRELVSERVVQK